MLKCYMLSRQRGRAHNRFRVTGHGTCTRKDKGNWWGKEQGPLARKKAGAALGQLQRSAKLQSFPFTVSVSCRSPWEPFLSRVGTRIGSSLQVSRGSGVELCCCFEANFGSWLAEVKVCFVKEHHSNSSKPIQLQENLASRHWFRGPLPNAHRKAIEQV